MLGTRPDIAFVVLKMSQFSSNPKEEHLQKMLYIVRYISSSPDLCIIYSGTGNHNGLCAYSDTLCIDNQGAIFLASNPAQEGQAKHVQMMEHFVRQAIEFGEIQLYYVPTDQQFTNIFTKNLGKQKSEDGRKALELTPFQSL
jgi:hypothetical protein